MGNSELADIVASLETAVQKAYALGRGDALKEVVGLLKTEPACPKPTALLAAPEPPPVEPVIEPVVSMPGASEAPALPWYLRGR